MDRKRFDLFKNIGAVVVLLISAVVYLLTIEPTASFWDCGEFIASSYKLEVGHPPGNPVFQLFARFFTLFTDAEHAAIAVNAMSAICSALTIFFLYLTIVFLAKRIANKDENGNYGMGSAIAIIGSGLVGALAYCFSDTFWFSAVEGEVYAMSSLFTAMVFWAMTRWYEEADEPYSNRWIVLIALLIGLSIGVHLLNLLTIPALVFLYYYRKRENGSYTFWEYVKIFAISCVILALILFVIIPYLPKVAAWFDLFFVNVLGLPFNTGAAFFMILLLGLCFWGLFKTMKDNKVVLNTVLLCFTMITIGFSLFTIVIIRSSAKTPTNEYQPDNPFTLVRYLSREQYGSTPLIYGEYFDADPEYKEGTYYTPLGDEYIEAPSPFKPEYKASDKMFFPRMWSSSNPSHIRFYESYMENRGLNHSGQKHRKPTFVENMKFFIDYQMNWMYWRYFMWNFAGRQNDVHSPSPGENLFGNWECGIPVIDNARLGNQDNLPSYLANNKGKNHYFLLPLILGILGILYQFSKDKRGSWLTFLFFFMTGIAIVMYLNQPPMQVRERDYAYAGSFYAFSIWIGLAVLGLYSWISGLLKKNSEGSRAVVASLVSILCLGVPALMAQQNWDDHDRSNRYTSVEMASNYLNSVGQNGILITHGDNDTFPLWYAQEVEGIRTDVRICNTSLLGTDWHIDQMRYAVNDSAPLDIRIDQKFYLYGSNDWVYIYAQKLPDNLDLESIMDYIPELSQVMAEFVNPDNRLEDPMTHKPIPYLGSRLFKIPVNKENAIKYGIVDEKYEDEIPEYVVLRIPEDKKVLSKPELFMLDLLSHYNWDRPLSLLSKGGDLNIGIKDYLQYDGFSYRFIPLHNKMGRSGNGFVDSEDLYNKLMNVYSWNFLSREDYYVDYHHLYTFCGVLPQRRIFVETANALINDREYDKALEIMEKCQKSVPESQYPLDIYLLEFSNEYMIMSMIETYYILSEAFKANATGAIVDSQKKAAYAVKCAEELSDRFVDANLQTVRKSITDLIDAETNVANAEDRVLSKASNQRWAQSDPDGYLKSVYENSRNLSKLSRFNRQELEFVLAMEAYSNAHDALDNSKLYIEHLIGMTKTYGSVELSDNIQTKLSALENL